jgi:uncharacterized RmlC-like cupin family protein
MDTPVITAAPDRFVVRSRDGSQSLQGSHYATGVSRETTGATGLYLGIVTLAPGQRTRAHQHLGHETAHYMLSGEEVELWTGERLERREVARPGEFLFIPAGLPHVAVNRGGTPAVFVGARTEPGAVETAELLPQLDAQVP